MTNVQGSKREAHAVNKIKYKNLEYTTTPTLGLAYPDGIEGPALQCRPSPINRNSLQIQKPVLRHAETLAGDGKTPRRGAHIASNEARCGDIPVPSLGSAAPT